jgi:hypothetical protein
MQTTSFPPVTLTVTLTNEEQVALWNALEYKMKDLDHAAEWAQKNGYDSETCYRNEFAKLSDIKKKFK